MSQQQGTSSNGQYASVSGLRGRVLVVDPAKEARRFARRQLTLAGAVVDSASTEREALEMFATHDYDVVVTEIQLPSSSGFELVQECRKYDKPALFVLVSDAPELEILPVPACDDVIMGMLHKPYDAAELVEVTRRAATVARQRAPRTGVKAPQLSGPVLLLADATRSGGAIKAGVEAHLEGASVFEVERLRAALDALRERRFALAVVDLHVPDALGLDAVRRLHATDPDLAIVVLSNAHEDIAEQALTVGAQEILPKVLGGADLAAALRRALLRKRADREVRYRATHDALTGLPNVQHFHEQLAQAVARVRRTSAAFALMYIDLDGFKPINDAHGHHAGDLVLSAVARRLLEATRDCDVCARLGGDEFAVLLEGVYERPAVRTIAQRVLRALAAPIQLEDQVEVRVTASIGVALCPESATSVPTLMDAADAAMFEAKEGGRSQYCFAAERGESSPNPKARLSMELRDAVADGDFYMVYQPQVDMRSHRVIGLEALLRWRRRDGNKVGPEYFVPILEANGLINEVGAFALREACRHASAWSVRSGRSIRVAVNVSPLQLEQEGFAMYIAELIEQHALKASQLELEITETALMRDTGEIQRSLLELQQLGVRVVLDDFGTGYASLSYLQKYPVNGLKIDRSFVEPLMAHKNARVLVGGIIDLAHQLGLAVIAEGVEHMEQVTYLRDRGCDACQGFLFGRPHYPGQVSGLTL